MSLLGKRVLVRVDGSHAIGLGHIYRMKSLALGMVGKGASPAFLSLKDETANRILRSTGLPVFTFADGHLRTALPAAVDTIKPDLIVQDTLATNVDDVQFVRSLGNASLIHIDDTGAGLTHADLVINSSVFHWGAYAGHGPNTKLFEGAGLMILQNEIEAYRRDIRATAAQAKQVLVGFGGTDTHGVTETVLNALDAVTAFQLEVTVILGPGSEEPSGLSKAVEHSPHQVVIKRGVADLFAEFHGSDLVFCGGGVALYELATLGTPCLAVACEPHEEKNIAYWQGEGSAMRVGFRNALQSDFATVVADLLVNPERRQAMSDAGRRVMAGSGLQRVLGILESELP